MSNHVELTDDERKEVATFWADYFRASGEGRQPTAFQLDAVNDPDVRDALLFWQIGADPVAYNPGFNQRTKVLALRETLGANPTGSQAVDTLTKLIRDNNERGVELEDLDTGSVWVLAHVMWLLLGGAWAWACDEAETLATLAGQYMKVVPNAKYPHRDALYGLGISTGLLALHAASGGDEHGLELSARMYGLDENSTNTRWARQNYAQIRAERLKNEAA